MNTVDVESSLKFFNSKAFSKCRSYFDLFICLNFTILLSINSFKMLNRCNNLESCDVPASNNLFSDPCPMVFKYLEIEYFCVAW